MRLPEVDRLSVPGLAADAASNPPEELDPALLETLDAIQRRVLWLATSIVHHANYARPNPDGTKVGGHQASSASMVTILTALYFHFLRPGDRVAVKPHASPAFHAVKYLLGRLPREYLTSLRAYRGLQAYPSRTKDPDGVDFSTGSVGLGAVAPAFAALAHQYAQSHFGAVTSRRFIALRGDAKLDEGSVWEAILDSALEGLENLLLIVDLNRQSLDRVIPGIRAANLKQLFANAGWQVLEVKYGRRLQALFARPGGHLLRPVLARQTDVDQIPAFGAVATVARPAGRALRGITPIFALKTRIGLAEVVQIGQHRQACAIDIVQSPTRRALQRAGDGGDEQQPAQDGSHVRHVVGQTVRSGLIQRSLELSPWEDASRGID